MVSCAVATCNVTHRNNKERGIHFHRFPKEKGLALVWRNRCKRKEKINLDTSVICSIHFAPADFEIDKVNRMLKLPERELLKVGVLPTLNLPGYSKKQHDDTRNNRVTKRDVKRHGIGEILTQEYQDQPNTIEEIQNFQHVEVQTTDTWTNSGRQIMENKKLRQKLKNLSAKNVRLSLQMKVKDRKNKILQEKLSQIFSPAQMKKILGTKKVKWSSKDIAKAIGLTSISKSAYDTIRNVWKIPVPTTRTLRNWTQGYSCLPGFLNEVVELMKHEGLNMREIDRLCVMNFDEMNIRSDIVYDKSLDMVYGPHSHAQVILLNGLCKKWRQPIYYQYDQKVTKEILFSAITLIHKAGFIVCGVVSDLGGTNRELWNELGISIQCTSFFHPVQPTRNIYIFSDAPHMLKLLRNHLLDGGWVLEDGTVVDKLVLEQLLLFDSQEIKLCPKLTQRVLDVKGAERMKVAPAAKIFSNHTATLSRFCFKNQKISEFFAIIDDYFDIFNSKIQHDSDKPIRSAFGTHHFEQIKHLEKFEDLVSKMRAKFYSKKKKCWVTRTAMLPCQHGILVSIKSLKLMYESLKSSHELKFILTRRLNQDPLESLFSIIRSLGRTNDNPDSSEFRSRMKTILFGSKLPLPIGSNVIDDIDDSYYISSKLLESIKTQEKVPEGTPHFEFEENNEFFLSKASLFEDSNSEASLKYLAGYIAFVLKKKHSLDYGNTTRTVVSQNPENESNFGYEWTQQLSRGGLLIPNSTLMVWIESCELHFLRYFPSEKCKNRPGILKIIRSKLEGLNPNINALVIKEYCKIRLKIRIKLLNARRKLIGKERFRVTNSKNLKKAMQFCQ